MSIPKPPFHSASEELLYNIYLKIQDTDSLKESDISTLAKLNAIIIDADLMKADDIISAINDLKGNVPEAGNTLEKLFNIIQGINYLKAEDIDTLAELNAILSDADLIKTEDLQNAINVLKANVPLAADTLEKLFNLIQPVLTAWVQDGNAVGSIKSIGTKDNFPLPFITNNIERVRISENGHLLIGIQASTSGLNGFKLQVKGVQALGVSGSSFFRDGNFNINLGEEGNPMVKNTFQINSYVAGLGGVDFKIGSNNLNASIEIEDSLFGGTKNEMLRLSPGGYANTAILVRPNDGYNTSYGYRYILQGTNPGQQSRYISAFHAQLNFLIDDGFPITNRARLFAAEATVTNHYLDGFYADVRGTDPNAQVFAYHSIGSRILFDGTGMSFITPVVTITTDGSPHAGANNSLLNGNYIQSAALYIIPQGAERTGLIISPGHSQANGIFVSPQQALGTYNYDGYLMCLQYSTGGNNINGGTSKPMLYIRKHNALLNGFDHTGSFIRLEENIGSSGAFLEAYKFDNVSSSLKLKFSINKDGVVSIGQVAGDPANIAGVGRVYFVGDEMKFVAPSGVVRTLKT